MVVIFIGTMETGKFLGAFGHQLIRQGGVLDLGHETVIFDVFKVFAVEEVGKTAGVTGDLVDLIFIGGGQGTHPFGAGGNDAHRVGGLFAFLAGEFHLEIARLFTFFELVPDLGSRGFVLLVIKDGPVDGIVLREQGPQEVSARTENKKDEADEHGLQRVHVLKDIRKYGTGKGSSGAAVRVFSAREIIHLEGEGVFGLFSCQRLGING